LLFPSAPDKGKAELAVTEVGGFAPSVGNRLTTVGFFSETNGALVSFSWADLLETVIPETTSLSFCRLTGASSAGLSLGASDLPGGAVIVTMEVPDFSACNPPGCGLAVI